MSDEFVICVAAHIRYQGQHYRIITYTPYELERVKFKFINSYVQKSIPYMDYTGTVYCHRDRISLDNQSIKIIMDPYW